MQVLSKPCLKTVQTLFSTVSVLFTVVAVLVQLSCPDCGVRGCALLLEVLFRCNHRGRTRTLLVELESWMMLSS